MKKHLTLALAIFTTAALAAGCKQETPKAPEQPAQPAAQPAQPAAPQGISGKVAETMNAGGYTYVLVDTGTDKVWAAAPETKVNVGDPVAIPGGMLMEKYESKSLQRTFDKIYFCDAILVGGEMAAAAAPAPGQMPEGHPPLTVQSAQESGVDVKGIKKAEGGLTVAELFSGKASLSGKEVKVRGKVVKFSPEIMGKNWIHLQDGTGGQGSNDLTITTKGVAKVGDTVMVVGKLMTDKDFGYGYKYDVMIEDAQVSLEK